MNSQSTKPLTPQKFHLPSPPFYLPPPGFGELGRGNHLGTVLVGWWMVCVALVLVRTCTPIYLLRPKPSRAGLEMWSMLSLIESPGLAEWGDRPREVEEEEDGRGWRDGAMERGQTAWLGDMEPINFLLQPISHVLSLCPFLLMTHFLCPSAHFQAKSEKRKSSCVCLSWMCMFVCVSVWNRVREWEWAHTWGLSKGRSAEDGGGWLLSKFPLPRVQVRTEKKGGGEHIAAAAP